MKPGNRSILCTLLSLALLVLSPPVASAQEEAQRPDWVQSGSPIDEDSQETPATWVPLTPPGIPMTPQRMVELRTLDFGARSQDPGQKLATLRRIDQLHERGELEPWDRDILGILHFVATEGVSTSITEGRRRITTYPHVRMHAVRTLGNVGGPYALAAVLEVIRYDTEPLVLGEAAVALGRMETVGREQTALLTNLIERMNRTNPSDYLAYQILAAIEELDAKTTGIRDPDLFRAVISLARSPYSSGVQRKALRVIDILRGAP